MSERESLRLRRRLVGELERRGRIRTALVRDAFLAVAREAFLREFAAREGLKAVYRDDAIPTKRDASGLPISSSSQPAIMAEMLEQLALEPGMRVLEIGAGTGYNAALLCEIVGRDGRVATVDVDPEIVRAARAALRGRGYRARVVTADGRDGLPAAAPFDRIVATASSGTVPLAWFEQLVEGGLVEVPLRLTADGMQVIATLEKTRGRLVSTSVVAGGFMPLRGPGEPSPVPALPPCLVASWLSPGKPPGSPETPSPGPLRGQAAPAAPPPPPLRQLSGHALATLSAAAKRRLLALALADGRRQRLGLRADAESLMLYLRLTLPTSRAVTVDPGWTVGTIGRDGRSLAYVEAPVPPEGRSIGSITVHGGDRARDELLAAIRAWDRRGRPGPAQLRFTVAYRGGRPTVRRRWSRPRSL